LVTFVVTYARLTGTDEIVYNARSNVQYTLMQSEFLGTQEGSTCVLRMRGFLFFASARTISEAAWRCVSKAEGGKVPLRHLIIDFSHCVGIDSSVVTALQSIGILAQKHNVSLMLAEARGQAKATIHAMLQVTPHAATDYNTVDLALEECELRLLSENNSADTDDGPLFSPPPAVHPTQRRLTKSSSASELDALHFNTDFLLERQRARFQGQEVQLGQQLRQFLRKSYGTSGSTILEVITKHMQPLEVPAEYVLFEQGAPMSKLIFVESGFLSCFRKAPPSSDAQIRDGIRMKKFGPGTFIGCPDTLYQAPGLDHDFTHLAHATAITDTPCCIHVMECSHLEVLEREAPATALELYKILGLITGTRLHQVEQSYVNELCFGRRCGDGASPQLF